MKYTPVGVDIAKHLIQVHFIDEHTGEVIDKQLRRQDFLMFFCNREPCLIGMEACGGSQHWARELTKQGHKVRLLQARFVKAFVMGNKTMLWMPGLSGWQYNSGKEIAVKTEEQQSVLVLHRSRRQLVKFRTMQINSLHGTLTEFGETIHKRSGSNGREFPEALERMKERLPPYLITVLENQYNRLNELDSLIEDIEKQLTSVAKQNETCKRLLDIPGVGPLIATAAVATMGKHQRLNQGESSRLMLVWCPNRLAQEGKSACWG